MGTKATRWVRTETSRQRDAWELRDGSEVVAELERDRPSRWHGNGVGGSVVDMDAPANWSVTLWDASDNHALHHLPRGLTVAQAKTAVTKLIEPAKP